MSEWRERLIGYTGLHILFAIWSPLLWFVVSARDRYRMEMFELSRMHWTGLVVFFTLLALTILAQFGFVLIAMEHGEVRRLKDDHRRSPKTIPR